MSINKAFKRLFWEGGGQSILVGKIERLSVAFQTWGNVSMISISLFLTTWHSAFKYRSYLLCNEQEVCDSVTSSCVSTSTFSDQYVSITKA